MSIKATDAMKELAVGLLRNSEAAIAAILKDNKTASAFHEEEQKRNAVMYELLAQAAFTNAILEAGTQFHIELPETDQDINAVDLRTFPPEGIYLRRAIPLSVDEGCVSFQATSTSALALHPDRYDGTSSLMEYTVKHNTQ